MSSKEIIEEIKKIFPKVTILGSGSFIPALKVNSISLAKKSDVCFCNNPTEKIINRLNKSGISLLFVPFYDLPYDGKMRICITDYYKSAFAFSSNFLIKKTASRIHQTAVIDASCDISDNVSIGQGCFIGPNCSIGDGTVLHPNVTLVRNSFIGKNVIIHSGAVVGGEGFSPWPREDDKLEMIRHTGNVVIEDEVEIGTNSNVSIGTLEDTRIREGSKIDSMCHIGHNADIGPHASIAAGTSLGRSRIGRGVWLGIQCCIIPGNDVADFATVGGGAVVTKSVKPYTTVAGVPAKVIERKRGIQF